MTYFNSFTNFGHIFTTLRQVCNSVPEMTALATSWKRSKHNGEKLLSDHLLNEEIPRLEGIARGSFVAWFHQLLLMLSQCRKSVQNDVNWNLSSCLASVAGRFVFCAACVYVTDVLSQPHPGSNNQENERGRRRGDSLMTKSRIVFDVHPHHMFYFTPLCFRSDDGKMNARDARRKKPGGLQPRRGRRRWFPRLPCHVPTPQHGF